MVAETHGPSDAPPEPAEALQTAANAIAGIRQAAQLLVDAANVERTVGTPDGLVQVTGAAGRLRSVTLDETLVAGVGHGIDHRAFVRDVLAACREALIPTALSQSLAQREPADGVPPDPALTKKFADRTFVAVGRAGLVTATVAGTGELTVLEVAASAVRGDARADFGNDVVDAVDGAVIAYRKARHEVFGLGDFRSTLMAQTDAFRDRMDAVKATIEGSRANVQGRLAEAEGLLAQRRGES